MDGGRCAAMDIPYCTVLATCSIPYITFVTMRPNIDVSSLFGNGSDGNRSGPVCNM